MMGRSTKMETAETPRKQHWSLTLLGIGLIVVFAYYGESVLAVLFFSILLSFVLSPMVEALGYFHIPRGLAALIAVVLLVVLLYAIASASYNQAVLFVDTLPTYSQKIRSILQPFQQQAERFEKSGEAVGEPEPANVVTVRPVTSWTDVLTHGVGTVTDILLAASFIPFLAYFLLTWRHHARSATVMLFPLQHRNTAFVTLGLIGKMLQSFIVGNLLIGLLISGVSVAIFGLLHVPFFYFVGFLSGFLSLVPYLGLVLAILPPILVGLGQLEAGDLALVVVVVLGLHLLGLNVLYPKLLGSRLRLNPLAVTVALLFWGWIWGAIGLVLAIPITGTIKIIFDHVESMKPYADWLGE
jgi:predicted PurR-regulated permease PerM